jgi:hypothetical protein
MKSLRLAQIALGAVALSAVAGCRAANSPGFLSRNDPLPPAPKATAAELFADHNRNARLIESLEARPEVFGNKRRRVIPGASGKLALERPRNFRLEVTAVTEKIADIGSNDEEFWFWFKDPDDRDKAIYYCNYDDDRAGAMAIGLQPDWIVDALGLRVITNEEFASMKVTPGKEPGVVVLTQRVSVANGRAYFKEIVLGDNPRRILEQRVYAEDHATMIARSVVKGGFDEHPLPAERGTPTETVYIPKSLVLELPQEHVTLNVVMQYVKVNQLDQARRTALFTEPKLEGFARVNLAERILDGQRPEAPPSSDRRTTIRQTIPAPPPCVQLNTPSPLGLRRPRPGSAGDGVGAFAAAGPSANAGGVEAVIGAPIPTVAEPGPEFLQANSGWRNSLGSAIER